MRFNLPKGRNHSKQNLDNNKYYGSRHSDKASFFSLLNTGNVLQDKRNSKTLQRRQSQDLLNKAKCSNQVGGLRVPGSIYNVQDASTRYGNLNSKIKGILDMDDKASNQIKAYSQAKQQIVQSMGSGGKNGGLRRNQSMNIPKQSVILDNKKQPVEKTDGQNLYFLECLKRKNAVTTEFYINIHTSILTFKQFYKLAQQTKAKLPDPKIPAQTPGRKTIIFDMDETLIHTSQVITSGFEIKVPFKSVQGRVSNGYVNVRPHAKQILKNLSKQFDVIVFTAGNKCYADPILDHIDPTGCIQHRLYRQSCTFVANQLFVKDLRIFGRKLENIILVDNAPHSYMMQLANGIPILNYFKGKDDNQLYTLEKYLMSLLDVSDVRITNSEYFRLHEYMKFDTHDKLINSLYSKKI